MEHMFRILIEAHDAGLLDPDDSGDSGGSDNSDDSGDSGGSDNSDDFGDSGSSDNSDDSDDFNLLDLEASGDFEDDFDSAAEDEFWNGEDSDAEHGDGRCFTNFGKLPPELRLRVWELAYADLNQPRVLQFCFSQTMPTIGAESSPWFVHEGMTLRSQTLTARRIMAVNREARAIVLKAAPNTLRFTRFCGHCDHAIVRFHQERDVVMVDGFENVLPNDHFQLQGFAENVKQLTTTLWDFTSDSSAQTRLIPFMKEFPNLRRLFVAGNEHEFSSRQTVWCGSDFVYMYDYSFVERIPGFRRRTPIKICWPNADDYADYAKNEVPPIFAKVLPDGSSRALEKLGIQTYPMVTFEDQDGLARFEYLKQKWQLSLGDVFPDDAEQDFSSSNASDDDDDDIDEYESEGIDDDIIEEVVAEQDDGDEVSGDEIIHDEQDSDDGEDAEPDAQFSSPEPEPGNNASAEGQAPGSPVKRSNKRPIVTDSDDDEEATENPRAKRARTSRVVTSDSEDDDDEVAGFAGGIHNAVVGDDTSREKEVDGKDSDTEEDEDEEEEEEEEAQPKHRSLANRLRLHRKAHPVSSSSEDESHDEDDDDDESDEDDEESRSEDDLIDGICR